MPATIHYSADREDWSCKTKRYLGLSQCGHPYDENSWVSDNPDKVTCGLCQRTRHYRLDAPYKYYGYKRDVWERHWYAEERSREKHKTEQRQRDLEYVEKIKQQHKAFDEYWGELKDILG